MKRQIVMLKLNNFSTQYRIYYEDTDAGGVVYYANYLKFYERARTDFLRSINIIQSDLKEKDHLLFVVKNCHFNCILPAKLDDLITVETSIGEIGGASILMQQKIIKDNIILNEAEITIACVDSDSFKVKRISPHIKTLLMQYVR